MAKKKSITTVDRKLYYFKITAQGGGDNGLFGMKLTAIDKEFEAQQRETDYKGNRVRYDISNISQQGLIYGTMQQLRENAPSIRKEGEPISKPIHLDDDEGINEITHFIYNPTTSNICIEYNYHGPKIGMLVSVINDMYKQIDKQERRNTYMFVQTNKAAQRIKELHNVRAVVARYKKPYTVAVDGDSQEVPEVFEQFKAPKEVTLEVAMKSSVKGGILMKTTEFFNKFLTDERQIVLYEKLQVKVEDDETGKPHVFDLIKDQLVDEVIVPLKPDTREVDTDAIFEIMGNRFIKLAQRVKT